MLASVLDAPQLADGGAPAMAEVGRWRIEHGFGQRTAH